MKALSWETSEDTNGIDSQNIRFLYDFVFKKPYPKPYSSKFKLFRSYKQKKHEPITEKTLFEQAKHMTKSKTNE